MSAKLSHVRYLVLSFLQSCPEKWPTQIFRLFEMLKYIRITSFSAFCVPDNRKPLKANEFYTENTLQVRDWAVQPLILLLTIGFQISVGIKIRHDRKVHGNSQGTIPKGEIRLLVQSLMVTIPQIVAVAAFFPSVRQSWKFLQLYRVTPFARTWWPISVILLSKLTGYAPPPLSRVIGPIAVDDINTVFTFRVGIDFPRQACFPLCVPSVAKCGIQKKKR